MVKIFCNNTGAYHDIPLGTSLKEISQLICPSVKDEKTGEELPILAALVDYKLKELDFKLAIPHYIKFIGYNHPDGQRTYSRSLCFVLQKTIREIYPDKVLQIDYTLPNGLYCEIHEVEQLESGLDAVHHISQVDICAIKERMQSIIDSDLPFIKSKMNHDQAREIFINNNQKDKANLVHSLGRLNYSVYSLDGVIDTFYGPLLPSTGYLDTFNLSAYHQGFCLQVPTEGNRHKIAPNIKQDNISISHNAYADWCALLGVTGTGTLNKAITSGSIIKLIQLSEALQERKYADLADLIYAEKERIRIVFLAGPSSSGKTSSSKRLALQCQVLGLKPRIIELDNYFVNRESTPIDENGEYDYESLHAMDLNQLNKDLNSLLNGEKVEIPKFNFKLGQREYNGDFLELKENEILIMEGIHALNPDLTPSVDTSRIFKLYVSALTSLSIDENNTISTSDNRLLRRIVRDNRTRGVTPEDSLIRWSSVRRGENKNIFPYQENADAVFNSAHIFELPALKYYAEPLLRRIPQNSPAYTEAVRLLKFLDCIIALTPEEINTIPPTSIMREFIGGQCL